MKVLLLASMLLSGCGNREETVWTTTIHRPGQADEIKTYRATSRGFRPQEKQ